MFFFCCCLVSRAPPPRVSSERHAHPDVQACNKSEKITAHPVDFIRKRLEKEIELLRATTGTLEARRVSSIYSVHAALITSLLESKLIMLESKL